MHQYSLASLAAAAFCAESACWFDEVYLLESTKEIITEEETLAATQEYYTASLSCAPGSVWIKTLASRST